jgi:hypothetical protein
MLVQLTAGQSLGSHGFEHMRSHSAILFLAAGEYVVKTSMLSIQ